MIYIWEVIPLFNQNKWVYTGFYIHRCFKEVSIPYTTSLDPASDVSIQTTHIKVKCTHQILTEE